MFAVASISCLGVRAEFAANAEKRQPCRPQKAGFGALALLCPAAPNVHFHFLDSFSFFRFDMCRISVIYVDKMAEKV